MKQRRTGVNTDCLDTYVRQNVVFSYGLREISKRKDLL